MKVSRYAGFSLLLMLPLVGPITVSAETSALAAEEQLDNGLKEFGYQAGLSLGCVATEQVAALEREVLDVHADLGRLLGTDRAFLFAAAFGYGSSVLTPAEDCESVVEGFEKRMEAFQSRDGAQP
jgi:hypothetical protein